MQFIDRVGVVVGAKVEVIRDRTIEVKFHSIDVKNRDAIYSLVIFAPDEETYDRTYQTPSGNTKFLISISMYHSSRKVEKPFSFF